MKIKLTIFTIVLLFFTNWIMAQAPTVPVDASTGVSTTIGTISWTAFGSGTYDVEVGTTLGGSDVATAYGTLLTTVAVPVLSNNTIYYWQVRDKLPVPGPFFQYSFTTRIAAPVITFPLNLATNVPLLPNVTWTFAGGTTGVTFDVELSTDAGSTWSNVTTGLVGTSTNYQFLSSLAPNSSYVVRVRAKKAGEADRTSSENSFSTNTMSPANYATGISVLPTFTWTGGSGPYTLVVSVNSNFSSPVINEVVTSPHSRTYTTTASVVLSNGTLYYWKITEAGPTTVVQGEFTTVTASTPFISTISPSGTSATIYWSPIPYSSGLKYDVYQSTSSNMAGFSTVASSTTNTYVTVTGLTPGSTYYFIIRSKNSAGTVINSYSAVQQYDVPGLPKPYASYPTTGVTNYFNPPTFYWYLGTYYPSLTFVVKYRRSDQVMPGGTTAQTALTGYFHTASTNYLATLTATLTAGATYYWQVASTNDGGTTLSTFSDVADFVVYSSTPTTAPVPYLSWPVGGATSYLNPPTLYWYTGTYATGLYFQVDWTGPSSFTTGWIADNLYYTILTTLTPGTYTWRVRSALTAGGGSPSAWSSTETFVIPSSTSSVSVPFPTAPVGIEVSSLNPTLYWWASTPPALTYRVRMSPYSDVDGNGMLNHVTADQSTGWVSGTSKTFTQLSFPTLTLVAGTIYYWQVQATPDAGVTTSSWSYVASFTTAAGAQSVVPFTVSPIKGQPINTTSAVLTWASQTQPQTHLKYDVEYSKTQDFKNSLIVKDLDQPFVKIDGLTNNTKYYWRVSSKNNTGSQSMYSSVASFSVGNVTDVPEEQVIIPTSFELSQNYPNPFNPTTRISYALPQNSYVSIKIYDMLGREVKTLVNREMMSGNHVVEWNGEDNGGSKVSSGAYIYKITAGSFTSVKKMVLVK